MSDARPVEATAVGTSRALDRLIDAGRILRFGTDRISFDVDS